MYNGLYGEAYLFLTGGTQKGSLLKLEYPKGKGNYPLGIYFKRKF